MKRAFTFMMALVLVFSLGITAFADTTTNGSITITNATVGENYSVYKIFEANYPVDAQGNPIKNAAGQDIIEYKLTDSTLTTQMFGATPYQYSVTDAEGNTTTYTASSFFEFNADTDVVTLKNNVDTTYMYRYLGNLAATYATAAKTKEATDVNLEFIGLDAGYYVIKRNNGSANAVTITTTKPNATVIDKSLMPAGDIAKEVSNDGTSWTENNTLNVGDTVYFKVSFTATNYDGTAKVLYYTISDTMTPAWAAVDTDTIVITVDGVDLKQDNNPDTDWELLDGSTGQTFKVKVPWVDDDGFQYASSVPVVVTYSATVLPGAAGNNPAEQQNKNTVNVTWDTDDDNNTPDGPGHTDVTDTYVYNMGFSKVDGRTDAGLAGVKFELHRDSASGDVVKVSATGVDGVYVVDPNGTEVIETPDGGNVVIKGLAEGTYYLVETATLAGYNLLTSPQEVVVSKDTTNTFATNYVINNDAPTIENFTGVELPSTGGKGTLMLITFGTMVALAFGILMITQKKMSIYND